MKNRICSFIMTIIMTVTMCMGASFTVVADSSSGEDSTSNPTLGRSISTIGTAKVVGIRVEFPDADLKFDVDDTLEAFKKMFNGAEDSTSEYYPYESLNAYYKRSSYGKLSFSAEVYDYAAAHERNWYAENYGNDAKTALMLEALNNLNSTVDFSQFDGNDDGKIDLVYMHYSGGEAEWGSPWWSYEWTYSDEDEKFVGVNIVFDGKSLGEMSCLGPNSASLDGYKTVIHETGHALGLPDLYEYPSMVGTDPWSGTHSWDMMEKNMGDHNGYFKWLLGWIDEEDVSYVIANDTGMKVYKGSTLIQEMDVNPVNNEVSVDLILDAINLADVTKTGGIIVVSNTGKSKFQNCFVIQYDQYINNQLVKYKYGEPETAKPIPSGFRIYKVQGKLNDANGWVYSNNYGNENDKFIEVMDYDIDQMHSSDDKYVPSVTYKSTYECMLPVGKSFDYSSNPSTNFENNRAYGFTGLKFTTLTTENTKGSIRISYSSTGRLKYSEFSVKPTSAYITNAANINLETPWEVKMGKNFVAFVQINGKNYEADLNMEMGLNRIELKEDIGTPKKGDRVNIIIPKNSYIIGYNGDESIYNNEISFPLSTDLAVELKNKYDLKNIGESSTEIVSSDLVSAGNNAYIIWKSDDRIILGQFSSDKPGDVKTIDITSGIDKVPANMGLFNAGEGRLLLLVTDKDHSSKFYWINSASGSIICKEETSLTLEMKDKFTVDSQGNYYILYGGYGGYYLESHTRVNSIVKTNTIKIKNVNEGSMISVYSADTDRGTVLVVNSVLNYDIDADISQQELAFVETKKIRELNNGSAYTTSNIALKTINIGLGLSERITDLRLKGDSIYTISVNSDKEGFLKKYLLSDGKKDMSLKIETISGYNNNVFNKLVIGNDGKIALISSSSTPSDRGLEVILLNEKDTEGKASTRECGNYFSIRNGAAGTWLNDTEWFAIEKIYNIDNNTFYLRAYTVELVKSIETGAPSEKADIEVPNTGDLVSFAKYLIMMLGALGVIFLRKRLKTVSRVV